MKKESDESVSNLERQLHATEEELSVLVEQYKSLKPLYEERIAKLST